MVIKFNVCVPVSSLVTDPSLIDLYFLFPKRLFLLMSTQLRYTFFDTDIFYLEADQNTQFRPINNWIL